MKLYRPTTKQQILIGLILGLWILMFAFIMRPFEHGTMNTKTWVIVSLVYGISALLSYVSIVIFQKIITAKSIKWDYRYEISAFLIFYFLYTAITYICYLSPLLNGFYTLPEYLNKIIFKIAIVLTPLLILIRKFAGKIFASTETDDIIIKGENKLDALKIKKSQVICASNSQNYVEIIYLDGGKIKKKLIRASLKNVLNEQPFLIQIHRSHLINPSHLISWKDSNNIELTQMELPVSKMFKNNIPALK